MTASTGYLRFPHLVGDQLAFVAENDVWLTEAGGGPARRLTAEAVAVSRPRLSADGSLLAWVSRRRGEPEVFMMPVAGGWCCPPAPSRFAVTRGPTPST